ncbi:MAG TPA: hypothetical protein VMW41_02255 [Candidatus Bathyarchaeia archaeon]|nr:hypothetical protein [Candidatus Bathyarchaeia archaeon]
MDKFLNSYWFILEETWSQLSFLINKKPSEEYEYSFFAVNKNGGYQSSVIYKQNEIFNYWVPERMQPCEFSQAFSGKYPEIVKLTNP